MPKFLQHEGNDPFSKKQRLPQSSIANGCPVPNRRRRQAWKSPEQRTGRQTMNLSANSREQEPAEGALLTNFSELLEHLKSRSLYHLLYESVEDLAG